MKPTLKLVVAAALLIPAKLQAAPNVLIFMLDDVGFSHLGPYGGEIDTPNIDRVALRGMRFTNYHTAALCSPTRAALLTGRNHHSVGTGVVTEMETDEPGYTGRIPKDKMSWIRSMRDAGYRTAAFGKWHNTPLEEVKLHGDRDLWPQGLGFQRFYGFLGGDMSQWEPTVWDDFTPVEPHVGNPAYHFGADMTDKAIAHIQQTHKRGDGSPFLVYYAPGAMHAPHHVPRAYIDLYRGRFDEGWDKLREQKFIRQKTLGILPQSADLPPRPDVIPSWDSLSVDQKRVYTRQQEVFAGFLTYTDEQFGRILGELERLGIQDDTIIVVTSDNGASGEGGMNGSDELHAFNGVTDSVDYLLAHLDDMGTKTMFNHYPAGWALEGNTPFRYWKQTVHEGGVRDPFIMSWPRRVAEKGTVRNQFSHVVDLGPTIMELAGVGADATIDGIAQAPFEGTSFAASLADPSAVTAKSVQYFEMLGNRGVWSDGWKAVTFHGRYPWQFGAAGNPNFDGDVWQLFDLQNDPTEAHDLAAVHPEKLAELQALFRTEAQRYNVFPLDDTTTARLAETQARLTGSIRVFTYHVGDIRTGEGISPPVKGRPHTLAAKVTIPKLGAEGVLATAGGRHGGYALYVKDDYLHYTYNFLGDEMVDVVSTRPVPRGAVALKMKYVNSGPHSGRVELYFDAEKVGEGEIARVQRGLFSAAETFDVGQDTGSPISDAYAIPFPFTGSLAQLSVTMDD